MLKKFNVFLCFSSHHPRSTRYIHFRKNKLNIVISCTKKIFPISTLTSTLFQSILKSSQKKLYGDLESNAFSMMILFSFMVSLMEYDNEYFQGYNRKVIYFRYHYIKKCKINKPFTKMK